ncbi:MAG: pantoate--beta-alanine ligase, partial [Acidimicrobiales bacterium]
SDVERAAAPVLHRSLRAGAEAVVAGERDPDVVRRIVAGPIDAEPFAELDYVGVVDAATFADCARLAGEVRILAAARFGRPRLLDNIGIIVPD